MRNITLNRDLSFIVKVCVCTLFWTQLSILSFSQENPDSILQKAYELRSANPQESLALIKDIDRGLLTPDQKDRYDFLVAYSKYIHNDYEGALESLDILSETASSIDHTLSAKAFSLVLVGFLKEWDKAFDLLDEILPYIDELSDKNAEENVRLGIINFYQQIDEHEINADYIKPLLQKDYSFRFRCNGYLQYFSSVLEFDKQKLSEKMLTDAIELCANLNEPLINLAIQSMYARYFYYKKDYKNATSILDRNIQSAEKIVYIPVVADLYELKSSVAYENEDFETAVTYANNILEISNLDTDSDSIVVAYQILYQISESQGNYKAALNYFKKFTSAQKKKFDANNVKMLAIQKARHEVKDKSLKISLLDKENSLLKTNLLLNEKTENNRKLVNFLMFLIVSFTLFWAYRKRVNLIKLREISQRDYLTDAANRHHFTNSAKTILKRAKSERKQISLILFDIDDFKKINDTYGHLEGDSALKMVTKAVQSVLRSSDSFGRLGGEEFGILPQDCDLKSAHKVAEKCRIAISKSIPQGKYDYVITASFGVSSSVDHNYDYNTLFEAADKNLFRAKDEGKNRVVI